MQQLFGLLSGDNMKTNRKNIRYYFYDYPEWSIQVDKKNILGKIYNLSSSGLRANLQENSAFDNLKVGSEHKVHFLKNENIFSEELLKVIWIRKESLEIGFATIDDNPSDIMQEIIYQSKCDKIISSNSHFISKQELPKLPGRGLYSEEARMDRVQFLRKTTQAKLDLYNDSGFDPEKLTSNVENYIGSMQVPVGIAGPLVIKRENCKELVYAPFATTEGALVASITRGATAISRAGGATTKFVYQTMVRTPVFEFKNMLQAESFTQWIKSNFDKIREETKKVSNFSNLYSLEPLLFGKTVWIKFNFRTGDASGQNMTTSCTNHACKWILEEIEMNKEFELEFHIIEGNASSDKKTSFQSMLQGRGVRVQSEVFLPNFVIEEVLKVSPEALIRSYNILNKAGQLIGMQTMNINVANVIGAIFTATGQDIASVHESSLGHFDLRLEKDGVYARLLLPSLAIGTIGGGTNLPYQKEMLEIMDCAGTGKVERFAEIICAFAMGLDLSTLSAIAAGHFARAHDKLGRNRPIKWLTFDEINKSFFQQNFDFRESDSTLVESYVLKEFKMGSSIITELTARNINKTVGLFPFRLVYTNDKDTEKIYFKDIMLKVKPLGSEVVLMLNTMASMCESTLASQFNKFKEQIGFSDTHHKELALYNKFSKTKQKKYFPKFYGSYENKEREIYICAMELMQDMELMNSAADVTHWNKDKIKIAIDGLADIQSIHYDNVDSISKEPWMGNIPSATSRIEKIPLWEALARNARLEHNDFVLNEHLDLFLKHIDELTGWWCEIDTLPKTLIHNDFNPRNLALRKTVDGLKLCVYDLELSTIHIPQRDLAEFLSFVLTSDCSFEEMEEYVEYHRVSLEKYSDKKINKTQWLRGFKLAVLDYVVDRVLMYLMAHTFRQYKFMERVFNTSIHMIELSKKIKK